MLTEGGQSGRLKERAQRQLQPQLLADACHHLHSQQGVASQGEEMVVGAVDGHMQELLPDACQQFLDRSLRVMQALFCIPLRSRQGAPVHFAIGRQG